MRVCVYDISIENTLAGNPCVLRGGGVSYIAFSPRTSKNIFEQVAIRKYSSNQRKQLFLYIFNILYY